MKKEGMVVTVKRCRCCVENGVAEPIYTFTKGKQEVDVCSPYLKDSGLNLKGKFPRRVRVLFQEIKKGS